MCGMMKRKADADRQWRLEKTLVTASQVGEKLRKMCLALPEAEETRTFGHETWRIGKKTFAVLEQYGGELVICFKVTHLEQADLIRDSNYFVAPYVGQHGWTCLKAKNLDWGAVERHIRESYRLNALKRHLKLLEPAQALQGTRKSKSSRS
jgi:predicted DNA-binding protein (MmcQ/YjbR family)